jgi:polyisoprenoid-binding protein YceI
MKTTAILALALTLALPLSASAAKKKKEASNAPKTEVLSVSPSASKITWEATKITKATHTGEVNVKSGKLMATGDKLMGGEFEIDMTSLRNTDLTDAGMKKKLEDHLRSEDFFSVDKFPTSKFVITKVEEKDGKQQITGDLSIKGKSAVVSFPADVKVSPTTIEAKGRVTVDRTKYNVRYNSAKFFSNLGDKVINDEFIVDVDIKAQK